MEKLRNKIEELEKEKQSLIAEKSIIYTECLKIAIEHNYEEIISYLNPDPQDLINAKESIMLEKERNYDMTKKEVEESQERLRNISDNM